MNDLHTREAVFRYDQDHWLLQCVTLAYWKGHLEECWDLTESLDVICKEFEA